MKVRSKRQNRPTAASISAGLILALVAASAVFGRALETASPPAPQGQDALAKSAARAIRRFDTRLHSAGNIYFCIGNWAQWGTDNGSPINVKDLIRLGLTYNPSGEFPKGTRNKYVYIGGFWFGGIIGTDTLVSRTVKGDSDNSGDEISSFDTVMEASTVLGSDYYHPPSELDTVDSQDGAYARPKANADEQFKAVMTDTLVLFDNDEFELRPHKPLGIEVTQYTYAWNSKFAQNFIIIELFIKNVGVNPISDFTLGYFCDYDIFNLDAATSTAEDDISGFLRSAPNLICPEHRDSLNVAWAADNDGDPRGGAFPTDAAHGVVGVRFLNAPPNRGVSFNWWAFGNPNWGPAKIGSGDPVGIPSGDRRTFYLMANQTIDYGQVYSAIDYSSDGWRPPTAAQCGFAAGADSRQAISCGPLKNPIMPGHTVRFALAYLNGNNFDTDPNPGQFDCNNPDQFFAKKNFSELAQAAEWAGWIYDAPGVADNPTPGSYRGERHLCGPETTKVIDTTGQEVKVVVFRDTVYYTGDLGPAPGPEGSPTIPPTALPGIPNLAGPEPPPCPNPRDTILSFETEPGIVRLMWNGRVSETTPDRLSKKYDFEGYRVYVARLNSADKYSLLASWDREDYRHYVFQEQSGSWASDGTVVPVERLRSLLHNPNLDPSQYPFGDTISAYRERVQGPAGDTITRYSYFVPWDKNRANTYHESDQIDSNLIWRDSTHTFVNERGDTVTYGYYHFDLKNLNPSIGQFFSVTSFDQGDPEIDLDVLESPLGECYVSAVPIYSAEVVERKKLGVAVYPNPYKISFTGPDGQKTSYFEQGWEGRGAGTVFAESDRRINFINLPDSATISIYTLAGDLVRVIDHPDKNLSTYSSKCSWDLVTRNAQAVVSGIYIYRVDSKLGSQVGKIVIIK